MTAFALHFTPDQLVIGADSLGYAPDRKSVRPLGFISKVIPIPHLRAVMFSRGMYSITVNATASLMLSPQHTTIEAAAAALQEILFESAQNYAAQQNIESWSDLNLLEFVFAGWSEADGRMKLWQYLSRDLFHPLEDEQRHYGLLSFPRLPAKYAVAPEGLSIDEQLIKTVQAAGHYFIDEPRINVGMRVGGEILCTDVTPEGIAHRTIFRFEDYEETRHAAAATVARILRGDLDVDVAEGLVPLSETIDSATGKPMARPAAAVPMSRQQRRAAEREAAKGRRAA